MPFSYYHDKNGVYRAYAQPEMKDAPIRVVRKEGDVYIEANIDFEGKYADQIYPGTEKIDPATGKTIPGTGMTYAEVTAQGIINKWGNGQTFNVGGQMTLKDSKGKEIVDNGGYPIGAYYLNPNDTVRTHVVIYSDSPSANNIMKQSNNNNAKNKYYLEDQEGSMSSHVFTSDGLLETIFEMPGNINDALKSGQLERIMYNWRMDEPNVAHIYPNVEPTIDGYMKTSAHETTHTMGLGDGYSDDLYRLLEASPVAIDGTNIYGQTTRDVVPVNDLMRGGDTVSDYDMTALLRAYQTTDPQFFPKGDDSMTKEIQKDGIKAIIKFFREGKIRFD